jgi:hypothetical protein
MKIVPWMALCEQSRWIVSSLLQEFAERVANKSTELQVPLLIFISAFIKEINQFFVVTNFLIHVKQEDEVKILPQTYISKEAS